MKRCPQCDRVEADDALIYCRVDGAVLVIGSASALNETDTRILPNTTDASVDRATAPTTALPVNLPQTTTRPLRKSKLPIILISVGAAMGLVVIGFLVIAAGNYFYFSRRTAPAVQSIAVMPFVNASGSPDVEYLSDGMTEMLISSLSQLPNLNVKARSSVFRYKGKEQDTQAVGKELNVQAILTGRVVQRGQDLSLYVELVDVASDKVIWSETYNRPMTNLIALQKDIARDVSKNLQTKLSPADEQRLAKNYTSNSDAYQLYLLGRFHWNKRSKADLYRAIDYYSQAVRVDPNYAIAYSGLADAYAILQGYDKSVSPRETQIKAREYALKALSLDDTLSEAHASNALILQSVDFDFLGAEREFKRAIELDPKNTVAYLYYALLLTGLGRFDEAEANMRRAMELEPLSQNLNRNYGNLLMLARRYDESEKQLRKAIELDPNFQTSYFSLANTLHVQGRYAEAVEAYAKARDTVGRPDEAAAMRASFKKGGWRGFVLDFYQSDWMGDLRPKYQEAARLVSIGENQRALDALEEAYAERESFLTILKVDPRFDPLRSEPRFQELLKKIGLQSTQVR